MSDTSFIYQVNGSGFANLIRTPSSYEANIRRLVFLVREPDRSTLSLMPLTDGRTIHDVTFDSLPTTFLQAAGTATAMTIELRRVDDDGEERLYTLGHAGSRAETPDVRIEFFGGTRSTLVYPPEVFDVEEAGDIFVHYFHTLTIPEQYTLREFDLA